MSATLNSSNSSALPHWFSPLVKPLIDPAVFDFWAGQINPIWSWERPLARVVSRKVEALDSVTLVLQPNRHCAQPRPGQHINISAEVNGRRVTRSYSITNVPGRDRQLSITVKRVEGGKLSTHLCRHARVGDIVELGAVFGEMSLPAQPQGSYLFLAAGSGITPLISMTRWLAQQGMPVDLTLIYWAKTRAELCFMAELNALAAQHPRFNLRVVLTHEADCLPGESQGFISQSQLDRMIGDLSSRQVFACGPAGFVDTARTLAYSRARSFQAEGFTPAQAPIALDGEASTVHLRLLKSQRTVQVSSGQTILQALEEQGFTPASGCRMGVCRTCVCTKHEGTTLDTLTGDQDSETNSTVRLCVSRARSDLTLDL